MPIFIVLLRFQQGNSARKARFVRFVRGRAHYVRAIPKLTKSIFWDSVPLRSCQVLSKSDTSSHHFSRPDCQLV